jgi:hypothetical protein
MVRAIEKVGEPLDYQSCVAVAVHRLETMSQDQVLLAY